VILNKTLSMNKLLFFAFWVLTLVVSYWVGLKSDSNRQNSQGEELAEIKPSKKFDQAHPESGEFASQLSPVRPQSYDLTYRDRLISGEDATLSMGTSQSLTERLTSSDPIHRLQAFAELLKKPDSSSIDLALQAYESLPGGPGRFSELKMLAFAWGQVDPVSALTWAKSQQHWDEHVASSSILDAWAREDSDSAIQWAKENFNGEENPYFVGIIHGLSESSLPQATDLMTELPYGRVRGRAAHILFEKVWSQGEQVAVHWAEHLPEGSLQNFAYGELGEKLARSDMTRAVEWLDSMEESEIKVAVSEDVAREMAKQDPEKAGVWTLNLPEGDSRQTALEQVAKVWAKKDPAATAGWINQFPQGTNTDPAIEQLVQEIALNDPAGAMSWAESITDPAKRKQLIEHTEKVIKSQKFPAKDTTQ
jgi:hypothetical protein